MGRDDFSAATIAILAKRVGNICSNPTCKALTTGPHTEDAKAVNVGVAAHIAAASPGGARFDDAMAAEHRRDVTNGVWLCQTCAKLVDNDELRYPTAMLQEWKKQAEENARAEIEGRYPGNAMPLANRIQVVFDDWELWQVRGVRPSAGVIVVSAWGAGDVRCCFKLRFRNTSPHEEQLHRLRVELQADGEVLLEDAYAIQYEIALAPNKWVTRTVSSGFRSGDREIFDRAESVWLRSSIVGSDETLSRRIAVLDHSKSLKVV